jgi:myo-inositol-1(or 4)-monophosphatase
VSQVNQLRDACAEAAKCGGAVLRDRLHAPRTVGFKGPSDLVTDADHASEAAVLGYLRPRFPGAAILAEESGRSGAASAPLRFIIDPLDGTTNYANGLPIFAVNVAVAEAVGMAAAATFDPMRDELFLSGRGMGATLNGDVIKVSACSSIDQSLLSTGFPFGIGGHDHDLVRDFESFLAKARSVLRIGSAALDLAYVACGRVDGFWEYALQPWDIAAGVLHVREAGGIATDCSGGEQILETGSVCAASAGLHASILEVLRLSRRGEAGAKGKAAHRRN